MDYKKARILQFILLFGGAAVGFIGALAEIGVVALIGMGAMLSSLLVWWLYYRCPQCHEGLGRGTPRYCPHCGAWLSDEPEPVEKKKVQHKKKRK